ncbi:YlmH/Sll1252 family protein [Anaerotignum faecicola]|nr:YlmH/Sll1252 family protein [Anaerotignum faecicola]
MLDKQALLRNVYQPDERLLLAKVLDQADFSLKRHSDTFTDFCDPKKMETVMSVIRNISGINFFIFGGSGECERRIIGFCPDYREIENFDFPIKAVKVSANMKFSKELSHRDFLGSVLGLGIDRGKVGDIFIFDNYSIIFAFDDIAEYIAANLERVGRTAVKTEIMEICDIQMPEKNVVEKSITVASLRLDAVIGGIFNISRGKASDLIEGEKVFINWLSVTNVSKPVKEGDMISVRGLGRAKFMSLNGKTKKGRIGIVVEKYI